MLAYAGSMDELHQNVSVTELKDGDGNVLVKVYARHTCNRTNLAQGRQPCGVTTYRYFLPPRRSHAYFTTAAPKVRYSLEASKNLSN